MYQTEWQGIPFSSFAKLSSTKLASADFYGQFYEAFFKRYRNWDDLSPSWRDAKERWADFVLTQSGPTGKVLSVGCGLGFMEHYIRTQSTTLELFVHEVAPSAWRWVDQEFSRERKVTGLIPPCMPSGIQFDLVYLATVDYALDDDALIQLLAAIRPFLANRGKGRCLLISASFQHVPENLVGRTVAFLEKGKALAAAVLDTVRLRRRGQFWGWMRTQDEYRSLMRHAGYLDIADGFIECESRADYWISGRSGDFIRNQT